MLSFRSRHLTRSTLSIGLLLACFAAPAIAIDSDLDEMSDAFETANGFDPLDADEDSNGTIDGRDDADSDGLGNAAEAAAGTNPNLPDSDGDGLNDGAEIGTGVFSSDNTVGGMAANDVIAADIDGDGDLDIVGARGFTAPLVWSRNDGQGSFGSPQTIDTFGAYSVVAADIDLDGDLDLATVDFNDSLEWYENTDGNGLFGAAQLVATLTSPPEAVVAADLDGDNDIDLVASGGTYISWFENTNGAGAFGTEQLVSNAQDTTWALATADIDVDGDLDIVGTSINDGEVAWYANDGSGNFGAQNLITTSPLAYPIAMAVQDIDGDGDPDVLYPAAFTSLAWLENTNGLGAFGPEQTFASPPGGTQDMVAVDLDGDGDADVLSGHGDFENTLGWSSNSNGLGSFAAQQALTPSPASRATSVVAADLDGDGDRDILYATIGGAVAWREQTNVSNPLDADSDDDGLNDGDEALQSTDPFNPDTDGDGMLDGFEVANAFAPLDGDEDSNLVLDGDDDEDGDGLSNAIEQGSGTDPRLADTDADGLSDLVEVTTSGSIYLEGIDGAVDTPHAAISVDVDGDGDLDAVVVESTFLGGSQRVAWYKNAGGNGNYLAANVISTLATGVQAVLAADFDADGDPDLLTSEFNEMTWYENMDGLGSYGQRQIISAAALDAVAADLDGDGDFDILTAFSSTNTVAWHENTDGLGTFGAQQVISTAAVTVNAVFAIDIDGDGDIDALSASGGDDKIAWYANDGSGSFGPEQVITTLAANARSVTAADIDRDGDPDVLSASGSDDKIAWYENTNGLGAFGAQQVISLLADDANSVIAVDMDGDGDLDAASTSRNDHKIAWYENTDGLGSFGPQQVVTTSVSTPVSLVATDSNQDGIADLMVTGQGGAANNLYVTVERSRRSDPVVADTDGDGLLDGQEVNTHGSAPRIADTDGDGLTDAFEITHGFDPLDADEDTNGRPDGVDDPDIDELSNAAEQAAGTNPNNNDTDGDGLLDGAELGTETFAFVQDISPLPGIGSSTFQAWHAAVDVDRDGDLDIVSSDSFLSPNRPRWRWAANLDGAGVFAPPTLITDDLGVEEPLHPVPGDFDSDGDPDLLYSIDRRGRRYENIDGLGNFVYVFRRRQAITTCDDFPFVPADIDQDGDLDLVSRCAYFIEWSENENGLGDFGPARATDIVGYPLDLEVVDLDGDGDLDILYSTTSPSNVLWLENSDGRGNFIAKPQIGNFTGSSTVPTLGAGDLDRDGDVDVVVVDEDIGLSLWFENTDGLGNFGSGNSMPAVGHNVRIVDVDGDGDGDVVGANRWWENLDGLGSFAASSNFFILEDLTLADLDGDGDLDAVGGAASGDLPWYRNQNIADPLDADTDDDGLLDGAEHLTHGTDPNLADTDSDGWADSIEVNAGSDPLDPFSFPTPVPVPASSLLSRALLAAMMLVAGAVRLRTRARARG